MTIWALALSAGLMAVASSGFAYAQSKETATSQRTEDYSADAEFNLVIPRDPIPQLHGAFGDASSNYQFFANYCLDTHGSMNPDVFKAKFTDFTVQGAAGKTGLALYPEGPAFKVIARHFMEGDAPVIYHAAEAPYVALMLCVFPTNFPNPSSTNQPAKVKVFMTSGPNNEPLAFFETADTQLPGQIFLWNYFYPDPEIGWRIEVTPSETGRTDIMLGGRIGTLLPAHLSP